jgi:hypothetical protein
MVELCLRKVESPGYPALLSSIGRVISESDTTSILTPIMNRALMQPSILPVVLSISRIILRIFPAFHAFTERVLWLAFAIIGENQGNALEVTRLLADESSISLLPEFLNLSAPNFSFHVEGLDRQQHSATARGP